MSLCNNRIHRVLKIGLDDFMNASRQVSGFTAKPRPFLIPRLECKPPISVIPQWNRSKLAHGCSWWMFEDGFKCFNKWMNCCWIEKTLSILIKYFMIFMELTWFVLSFCLVIGHPRSPKLGFPIRSGKYCLEIWPQCPGDQITSHMVDIQFVSRS